MMWINSLEMFLQRIRGYLSRRSVEVRRDVCVECTDSGETVTLHLDDGIVKISKEASSDKIVMTRRQLTQFIFGPYPYLHPLSLSGQGGAILANIFPFCFPVWELDHC